MVASVAKASVAQVRKSMPVFQKAALVCIGSHGESMLFAGGEAGRPCRKFVNHCARTVRQEKRLDFAAVREKGNHGSHGRVKRYEQQGSEGVNKKSWPHG